MSGNHRTLIRYAKIHGKNSYKLMLTRRLGKMPCAKLADTIWKFTNTIYMSDSNEAKFI